MVTFSNERTCTTSRSGKISRLRGFLCKLCPVAHANLSLLKDHYKSDHNRDASNKLKSIKHANVLKKQLLLKYRNTQGSVSQVGGLKKRHRCHRCNFVSAKMKALADHIHMSHKSTAEYTYMCSLCSYTSVVPVYLANHTRRAHGQAAYDKYYKPLRQRILEKQMTSMEHPNADRKECPLCPYLSYSESDMIAHYISTHRKNRQSSKPQAHLDKKKNICKLFEASSKKGQFQCKKCTMLYFDTPLLLSIHYTEFHRSDFRQDFAIPSGALKKFKEVFQCGYCSIKIQGKQELCSHLNNHAAAFWKKMKPVFAEPQPTAKTVKARNKELPPSCKTAETMVPEMRFDNAVDLSCDQCGRAFMSLKGLRSHERSHAQLAALKRQGPLANHRLKEEHFSHRPGTTKPFHCRLCRYRTNLMILLKRHLEKSHQEEYPDKHLAISATSTEDMDDNFENEDPLEDENDDPTQKRRYLEPPDVQQQLNRYKRNVLNKNLASAPLSAAMPYEDGLYRCEFCNFTSEHLSSVRRHYLHRHNGKKLLRCKDCSFFTCFRKKYEMHIEAGGSSCLTEAPRDLKCPLCLYHTRNRNNMIDHIDLHREERVVPIEVRRPKLSHYLEGIVFRCHKCTYTSGCEENLRLHMSKHDDIKPYKCRLCYFDCIQLSELEAHLCDKHQVMRNHELVGQVNLVQLETRLGQANGEKKGNTNMEPAIKEEEEKKLYVLEKQGQESKDIKVEKDYKQNMSQQNTGEQTEDGMANLDEMNKNNAVNQKSGEPVMEKEIQAEQAEKTLKNHSETHERQGQERPERTGSDNGYHEEMDMSRLNWDIIPCEIQHPEEERRFNPDARNHNVEKQFPEEPRYGNSSDSRVGQGHGSANEDGEGRNEKYERHWEENMGSLEGTEEVSAQSARSNEAGVDQYGEMPVLENVYHSEGAGSSLNEEEGEQEKKTEKTCNKIQEEKKVHEQQDGADENPESEREETTGSDVASSPQDACTSVEENTLIGNEKPLACKLCGRTLTNTIELQRHVMRHGL